MCTHLFLSTCAKIRTRCRCPRTRSRPCTRALIKVGTGSLCAPAFPLVPRPFYPQSTSSSHTNNSLLRSFCKNGVCWRSKADERQLGYSECGQSTNIQMGGGGRSSRPWDKGDAWSQKIFFVPCASVWSKNKRGGARAPPPESVIVFLSVTLRKANFVGRNTHLR